MPKTVDKPTTRFSKTGRRTMPTEAVTREVGTWRRRLRRAAVATAMVVVIVGGTLFVADMVRWVLTSEALAISRVIVDGRGSPRGGEIEAELSDLLGRNILRVSTRRVLKRVESIAWVSEVRVDRVPPDALRVVFRERHPAACVSDFRGRPIAVDGQGVCFPLREGDSATAYAALPRLDRIASEFAYAGARIADVTGGEACLIAAMLRDSAPDVWRETVSLRVGRYGEVRLCTSGPLGEVLLPRPWAGLPAREMTAVRERLLAEGIRCAESDFRSERAHAFLRVLENDPPADETRDGSDGATNSAPPAKRL